MLLFFILHIILSTWWFVLVFIEPYLFNWIAILQFGLSSVPYALLGSALSLWRGYQASLGVFMFRNSIFSVFKRPLHFYFNPCYWYGATLLQLLGESYFATWIKPVKSFICNHNLFSVTFISYLLCDGVVKCLQAFECSVRRDIKVGLARGGGGSTSSLERHVKGL